MKIKDWGLRTEDWGLRIASDLMRLAEKILASLPLVIAACGGKFTKNLLSLSALTGALYARPIPTFSPPCASNKFILQKPLKSTKIKFYKTRKGLNKHIDHLRIISINMAIIFIRIFLAPTGALIVTMCCHTCSFEHSCLYTFFFSFVQWAQIISERTHVSRGPCFLVFTRVLL